MPLEKLEGRKDETTSAGAEVPNPYHSAVTIIIIVLWINIIIIIFGMVILPIIEDIKAFIDDGSSILVILGLERLSNCCYDEVIVTTTTATTSMSFISVRS
jgi:hypothetical protein